MIRIIKIALFTLFLLSLTPLASAQSMLLFMQRIQPSDAEGSGRSVCIVVYENGTYRMEQRRFSYGKEKETKVLAGEFTEEELDSLEDLLNAPELSEIHVPLPDSRELGDEPLNILIRREDGTQQIAFTSRKSRQPFATALRPILDWLEQARAHGAKELKNAKPDNCLPHPRF